VDDFEHRLDRRSLLLSNVMRDYTASIAQHQSDQISRLTVVSTIFLPLTFLTGLFGMNFDWMIRNISSESAFVVLGLILPALSAFISIALFTSRGLLFKKRGSKRHGEHPKREQSHPSRTPNRRGVPARYMLD